ncbi:unnamed protein product [Cunninghamella blakesleeana]
MVNHFDDNDKQLMSTTHLIHSTCSIKNESNIFNTIQQEKYKRRKNKGTVDNTIKQDNEELEFVNKNIPKTQVKQLFVGNLPFRVRWQDLKDLFRKAGQVQRADVALTYDGRSKGHGTVLFQTIEGAQMAINMLHNFKWFGRILEVREDRGFVDPSNFSLGNKVLISHSLDPLVQHQLNASDTNNNNNNTIDNEKHYMQMNKKINKTMIKQGMIQPGRQLFVGNIPYHCHWQDLKDLFRGAGNILRADVTLETDGKKNLGFGIVLYATLDDAKQAIAMYDGYVYQGRQLKVRFDKYAPLMPHYQDQYTKSPVYYSKKNKRDINSKIDYDYISDNNSLECLQNTNDDFNNENLNMQYSSEQLYSIPSGLSHSSSEKYNDNSSNNKNNISNNNNDNTIINHIHINSNISNNKNGISNNNSYINLFDNDELTDSNSTVFSSSFTTQLNYEQQQQQQSFTNFHNLNHQYYNKSPNNHSFKFNYIPSKQATSITTGLVSPPLYMYRENSPPIDANITFQLSPSSLDYIEKNTPSLPSNQFHNINSSSSHHPFLSSPYSLYTFQQQQQQQNKENNESYNNIINNNIIHNTNDHDFYNEKNSIDLHSFDIDDKIHLMNVINTIGLGDDSAGLKTDFILSSFIGNIEDDRTGDNGMTRKRDKFLEPEISMLWDQSLK